LKTNLFASVILGLSVAVASTADAGSLRGSPKSMKTQHKVAVDEDMTFLDTPAELRALVDKGILERIQNSDDVTLSGVSFPYARPAVRVFIDRLSAQYHAQTGERLVVTSLTRPTDLQPRNAHQLSVHPAGMAVDFRVPAKLDNRVWLEKALLGLEESSVLDVTREHLPPHYHVAVFPQEYMAYVEKKIAEDPPKVVEVTPPRAASLIPIAALEHDASSGGVDGKSIEVLAGLALLTAVFGFVALRNRYSTE